MDVYALSENGTLHIVTQTESGRFRKLEEDNFDDMGDWQVYEDENEARAAATDLCRNCFPNGSVE